MCVVIMQVEDRLETLRLESQVVVVFLGPGDWKLRKEGVILFYERSTFALVSVIET